MTEELSATELFAFKAAMEAQLEQDYVGGTSAKEDGAFDFLIGEWGLVRRSFGLDGQLAHETKGRVVARYVFDGRVIQEDFFNYRADGRAYRGGTALYTLSPSSKSWSVAAVDAATGATSYQPQWIDGEMRYESVVELPDRTVYTRSRIYNIADNSYEWKQEVSLDREAWHQNYHIFNQRKK